MNVCFDVVGMDVVVDYNNPPTQRLIPCPHCMLGHREGDSFENVHMFLIQDCAMAILKLTQLRCSVDCSVEIDASALVPDLLLNDLPPRYFINRTHDVLEFDPNTELLGRGGEGSVYRGLLNGATVAVKQHHTFHWMIQQKILAGSVKVREDTLVDEMGEGKTTEKTLENGTCVDGTFGSCEVEKPSMGSSSNRTATDSGDTILSDDEDPLYRFHQNRVSPLLKYVMFTL